MDCERLLDGITCKIKKDRKEFNHLICPITDQIMMDPVIASDRKTYERCAIAGGDQRGDTNQPLTEICPNYMAKDMIAAYKRGTVYLLQPQKYIGTYVLKLGESKHIDLTREKQYGKNTDIIYHVQCDYYWLVEKALKDEFNRRFKCVKIEKNGKMLPTKEYFQGNLQDMQVCWISVVSKIMSRHSSLDKQINVLYNLDHGTQLLLQADSDEDSDDSTTDSLLLDTVPCRQSSKRICRRPNLFKADFTNKTYKRKRREFTAVQRTKEDDRIKKHGQSTKGTPAKSSSSKKGPQSIGRFTIGSAVQVNRGTYNGSAGKIIRFSPTGLQTAEISIEGIETHPFLKLAFMSLEGEEPTPTKKSSCNQVERHGNSQELTEKKQATLDGWYEEKCTRKYSAPASSRLPCNNVGKEICHIHKDTDKIRQPLVWTSYQNYCKGKGINTRTTRHATMEQMREYLIGKGHKYEIFNQGKYWYCNLKLS